MVGKNLEKTFAMYLTGSENIDNIASLSQTQVFYPIDNFQKIIKVAKYPLFSGKIKILSTLLFLQL